MNVQRVCVYCASSRQCESEFHEAARELGRELAMHGVTIIYGGGLVGSMGALANAALERGGRVVGVLPQLMYDLEWGHNGLSELQALERAPAKRAFRPRRVEQLRRSQG